MYRTLLLLFAALSGLALVASPLRADPYTWGAVLTSRTLNYDSDPGQLDVLKYNPGPHPDLRSPDAPGTLRFLFSPGDVESAGFPHTGVQAYAFNTDLALTPGQFKGWTATPNGLVPGLGRFSWVLTRPSPSFATTDGFDITGLGNNISPSDFIIPAAPDGANSSRAWFAADIVAVFEGVNNPGGPSPPSIPVADFWAGASVPETAPEPSTIVLAGLGVMALLGQGVLRWRRDLVFLNKEV